MIILRRVDVRGDTLLYRISIGPSITVSVEGEQQCPILNESWTEALSEVGHHHYQSELRQGHAACVVSLGSTLGSTSKILHSGRSNDGPRLMREFYLLLLSLPHLNHYLLRSNLEQRLTVKP